MRSPKLLFASTPLLAVCTLASVSLADNTTVPSTSGSSPTTGTSTSPTGSTSTSTSSTVMSPSSPSVPTTSTTTTTQGAPPTGVTTPASTTTTTSADDVAASSATQPMTATTEPRESTTVYNRRHPNKALLITGSSVLVSTYVTTAAFAAVNGPAADKDLYIPVVGPWINLANRGCTNGECPHETRDTILIAGSGVLQGVGAALAVTSFFVPEKVPAARISAGPVNMQITPTAGLGSGGLGAIGTF
jgi:hypothetical protein